MFDIMSARTAVFPNEVIIYLCLMNDLARATVVASFGLGQQPLQQPHPGRYKTYLFNQYFIKTLFMTIIAYLGLNIAKPFFVLVACGTI